MRRLKTMKWVDYKMSKVEERGRAGGRKTSNNKTGVGQRKESKS